MTRLFTYVVAALFVLTMESVTACSVTKPATDGGKQSLDSRQLEHIIRSLTKDDREQQMLRRIVSENPVLATEKNLSLALSGFRWGERRGKALEVMFRHQYPNATKEELDILVDDQLSREEKEMFAGIPSLEMPQPINCDSMRFGQITHTSCY